MFEELNILGVFFENPSKDFSVREIARILKIAPATASKNLKEFSKQDILKQEKVRGFHLYSSNLDSIDYRDLKRYYNIKKIRVSGIIEKLNKQYQKPTIVLFGSFASGLDIEESDIDIAVFSENTSDFKERKECENKLKRELQFFVFKNLKSVKNKLLGNSILNGVVLQGVLNGFE